VVDAEYEGERGMMNQLRDERSSLLESRTSALTEQSNGLIRARVKRSVSIREFLEVLREILKGSGIRANKFDVLEANLRANDDLGVVLRSLIDELEQIAVHHDMGKGNADIPVTPGLLQNGFNSGDVARMCGTVTQFLNTERKRASTVPWTINKNTRTSKHIPKENRQTIIGPHAAGAIRLLLFTGCRLREILHLKWEHVDFERGLLFLPESKTGKKTIVLNAPALAVLNALPHVGSFVIAGYGEDKPRTDLKRPWAMVTKYAKLEGLRIHDLRHSFASFGAGGGMGLPIVGKLLGHTNATTTARYAHLDADPLRRASERIGSTIAAAMGETTKPEGAKVIRLAK
jgi:hypothetical protein